ncbi:MAG: DEAD/DEAH box helicase family protein, partial [Anaerolineaceae bacterium]
MTGILKQTPTAIQELAADFIGQPSLFLSGPASSGKTSAALLRLHRILTSQSEHSNQALLVLVPQRSLAQPYHHFLREINLPEGKQVSIQTMSSLVLRMISLFWPVIASHQIFLHPYEQPRFLTLETSQFYMAQIVKPMIDQGRFNNVTLPLFRLYSQIIDNLNKSALVGFPHTEIGQRLSSAWIGDSARQNVFTDVQEAVNKFREYCLKNNLVDYSLQVELFYKILWPNQTFQKYISYQYPHLIYDNSEEDPPYVHDII